MTVSARVTNKDRILRYWRRPEIRDAILDNLIWLILIIALFAFSFIPGYFQRDVLINIFVHSSFLAILVIGETLCLITGNFDLSVESVLAFTAMFAAFLMGTKAPAPGWGISPLIAIPVMLLLGAAIGAFNGLCVTKLKISPFIVTLATLIVFRGLTVFITQSRAIIRLPVLFKDVSIIRVGPIPVLVIVTIGLYLFFHFVNTQTLFGRKLFAVGGDRSASFAFGLNPDKVVIFAFMISGFLAAIAGWFMSARVDAALPLLGEGMAFDVMAAAVIGGVSLSGGKGSLIGALGGVLLLGAINAALTVGAVSPYGYSIVRGMVIFVAVGLDTLKRRLK